jgi:hypothetical protein
MRTMQRTDLRPGPVNLWYMGLPVKSGRGRSGRTVLLKCERLPDVARARERAAELLASGHGLGPLHIEDVETGAIVARWPEIN